MKAMMKSFGVAAVVLTMPLLAAQASAAEAVLEAPAQPSLTGTIQSKGILAQEPNLVAKADNGEKIVVARRGGRWVGPLVGGVALGLAIGAASRAHAYDYYERRVDRCEAWAYRCRRGSDRACYKFDRYCD